MRYSEFQDIDFSDLEIRRKHEGGNRQGSGEVHPEHTQFAQFCGRQARNNYVHMGLMGAAPESARMVLPLATPTRAYMKGNVRSWITYFWQRLDQHAQKEHRLLAEAIFAEFKPHFPLIAELITGGRMQYVENPIKEPGWDENKNQ